MWYWEEEVLNNNIEEKIWKIIEEWRANGVSLADSASSVLYLLTIKKLFKDAISNVDERDSQIIIKELSPALLFSEEVDYKEFLVHSSNLLEMKYGIQEGFFGNFIAGMRSFELWQSTLYKTIKNIMAMPDADVEVLADAVEQIMFKAFQPGYRMAPMITSSSLADILKIALNVENDDKFLDGTIGCGLSAIRCVKDTNASIQGMDLNFNVLQITILYTILSGREKFEFKNGDFTLEQSKEKFNKIAMDIPFAVKTGDYIGEQITIRDKWLGGAQGRDLDVLMVGKVLEVLEENGRATIVVPNSFLFRSGNANRNLRENILEKKMLRAVINLPPLHFETGARSSILLLEKNLGKVLFLDTDSDAMDFFQRQRREVPMLTEDGKCKLIHLLTTGEEIKGVSALVDEQQLRENQFDFSTSRYVSIKEELVFRDMQTINSDLKLLHGELQKIEKENGKMKLFN